MFESKRRALIFLILSFILAVIAGTLFYSKFQDLNADLGKMTKVYVAGKNLPSRQTIKGNDVISIEIPNRYVTDAHILSLDQLENQVSIIPLKEGDLITSNILKPYTDLTSNGNRLVEILLEQGNVHFDDELEYLDLVDIIVSHSFNEDGDPITELFMADVPVQKVFMGDGGMSGVALEVKSEAATELIHMENYADYIRVLKSGAGDKQLADTKAVEQKDEEPGDVQADVIESEESNQHMEEQVEDSTDDKQDKKKDKQDTNKKTDKKKDKD